MATILNKKSQPEEGDKIYLIREQDIHALNEIIKAAIQDKAVVSDEVESALMALAANISDLLTITDLARKEVKDDNQIPPFIQAGFDLRKARLQLNMQRVHPDPNHVIPIGFKQTLPRMKNR